MDSQVSPQPTQTQQIQQQLQQESYITIRLLMQGKEVGSIIGKKGENIKQIREQSGARITITDGSTPERIVTLHGIVDNVNKGFSLICKKFEDDLQQTCNANSIPPITLRLIVPASQCGSIIGKGGIKIKEVREQTGASIQVASEMLPGSTERAVTISGKFDSIIECFKQVNCIMYESPPKGDTIPYKPRQSILPSNTSTMQTTNSSPTTTTSGAPIIFANGQAFQVQGQYAIPLPPHEVAKLMQVNALGQTMLTTIDPKLSVKSYGTYNPQLITTAPILATSSASTLNGQQSATRQNYQSIEMNIPNELIGCIIGRGGTKISEIRQVSGANIKIGDLEEGHSERHVVISGSIEQIQLAQFLINTSQETFINQTLEALNYNQQQQQQQTITCMIQPQLTISATNESFNLLATACETEIMKTKLKTQRFMPAHYKPY